MRREMKLDFFLLLITSVAVALACLSGCVDSTSSPIGVWSSRGTWGGGDCGYTSTITTEARVTPTHSGNLVVLIETTADNSSYVTGQTLHVELYWDDALYDGGSTQRQLSYAATVRDEPASATRGDQGLATSGAGSVTWSGAVTCSQEFTLVGGLY